jgi:DNA-binding NtrC family response regulator
VSSGSTAPHRFGGFPVRGLSVQVVGGPDTKKSHTAQGDTITIGSASGNDLVLTDETVSRYHVELTSKGDRILLQDHGSTNGTRIGSIFIERGFIGPGTQLTLGKTTIKIVDGETVTVELFDEDHLGPIYGKTPEMRSLMTQIERAAKTNVPILLVGETGSGKDLVAKTIHEMSARANGPYETVDCAAFLPAPLTSELFGHEKDAYPGADDRHTGALERANSGTLFLDEIGEIPIGLQPVLESAIERHELRRVGGQKKIPFDVRIIAASPRDLRKEVNAETFRPDLYFKIGVVVVRIPPLRERTSDIPLLVERFLREAGHDGDPSEVISNETMELLKAHHWPGNVRELKNFVEAALTMGQTPRLQEAKERAQSDTGILRKTSLPTLLALSYRDARASLLREFESVYVTDLLERTQHNVSLAAREAKMNRSYLIELIKRLGIR